MDNEQDKPQVIRADDVYNTAYVEQYKPHKKEEIQYEEGVEGSVCLIGGGICATFSSAIVMAVEASSVSFLDVGPIIQGAALAGFVGAAFLVKKGIEKLAIAVDPETNVPRRAKKELRKMKQQIIKDEQEGLYDTPIQAEFAKNSVDFYISKIDLGEEISYGSQREAYSFKAPNPKCA